jgi:hypothetical protein
MRTSRQAQSGRALTGILTSCCATTRSLAPSTACARQPLLGKAWALTPELVVQGVTATAMLFTSIDGLYAAQEALEDILDNWMT